MDAQIINLIFLYIVIVLSAVIHEYSHGFVADQLGDSTPRYAGRLTLNPLAHMDTWGTVIIPLFLLFTGGMFIGWAKPVPYNPYNISSRHGPLFVGLAGPASNLLLALVLGLIIRFFDLGQTTVFLALVVRVNIFLALFNLIPVPPLDGSKVFGEFLPRSTSQQMGYFGLGLVVALFVAFLILPPVANFIFHLIVG